MHKLIALALIALLPAPFAQAQQAPPLDKPATRACFKDHRNTDGLPDCVGRAATACQTAHPQPETTIAISECLMAEATVWDRILNNQYKQTRTHFDYQPELGDHLRDAQRGWIAMRDADCALAYAQYGGGSMRGIAAANCRLRHTALRAFQLYKMRQP